MEFLWIRWFARDMTVPTGWAAKRLHCIGFLERDAEDAFGFMDPIHVIRGSHLLPAFVHGQTCNLLGPSVIRREEDGDYDWMRYYVDM
jgi:hypothetical protein